MPKGVYIRTEYHREINRRGHLRENLSPETLQKMRYKRTEYHRMINRLGHLGLKMSDEFKRKCSERMKFTVRTLEWRKNISNALRGRKRSVESIQKQREKLKQTYEQRFGKEKADKIKEKQSLSRQGKIFITQQGREKLSMLRRGSKNPNWRGGVSSIMYGESFNRYFKEKIRKRDSFTCICGNIQQGKKLSIHHIDYNKRNTSEENCISLCLKCHHKTSNGNREEWMRKLQRLLSKNMDILIINYFNIQ
jgi:hypothetical protein